MLPSEVNDKACDFMSLLRFSPLPESMLDEIKEVQMKLETDIRLKCIELALAANPGSTERAVGAAQAYFDFVMDRNPSAPERCQQSPSDTPAA